MGVTIYRKVCAYTKTIFGIWALPPNNTLGQAAAGLAGRCVKPRSAQFFCDAPVLCWRRLRAWGLLRSIGLVEISGFDKTKSETIFDRWLTEAGRL